MAKIQKGSIFKLEIESFYYLENSKRYKLFLNPYFLVTPPGAGRQESNKEVLGCPIRYHVDLSLGSSCLDAQRITPNPLVIFKH
ncbi:MAG: hypothetical protein PHU73_04405 [Patescibacteria group bacterium]|nr:hypothetical protein [Patescibacteria group bacterium]